MAGGSGSRNSTPPVSHPSSTPTPPQVSVMLSFSHFLSRRLRDGEIVKPLKHLIKMRWKPLMLPPLRQEVAAVSFGMYFVAFPSHKSLTSCPEQLVFNSLGLVNRGFHDLHILDLFVHALYVQDCIVGNCV